MIDPDAASGVIVEALYERLAGESTDDTGGTTMTDRNVPVDGDDIEEEVFNIDADIENADWLRGLYWDLPTEPERVYVLICGEYGSIDEQKANWEHFLTLPAARPMPPAVRAAVEYYLAHGGAAALPKPEPRRSTE